MKSILFRLQILGGNAKWRQLVEIQMKKTDFLWSGRKAILVGKMLIKKIAQYWQQWKIYNEHNQTNPIVFLISQVPKTQNLLGFYVKSILVNLTKVFVGQEFSRFSPWFHQKSSDQNIICRFIWICIFIPKVLQFECDICLKCFLFCFCFRL